MTEAEWLNSSDPALLMRGLQGRISQRKYDLFEVACAAGVSEALPDPICHEYLALMGRVAEGDDAPDDELDRLTDLVHGLTLSASQRACALFAERGRLDPAVRDAVRTYVALSILGTIRGALEWWYWVHDLSDTESPTTVQEAAESLHLRVYCDNLPLLRCIVGNPFRPVTADLSWLTITTVALATHIYAERAFDRLPILAEALAEAGCEDPDVLAHCRGAGPHVRGCWVVDLLLGKG